MVRLPVARTLLVAATLITFGSVGASAQETLTLDRAVQDAVERNPSLRSARAATNEQAAHRAEARASWFPRVAFDESWQRSNQPVFVFSSLLASRQFTAANLAGDGLNRPAALGFFRTSIALEQDIFDGGRRKAAVTTASLNEEIAQLTADETAARVAESATEIYGRILKSEALLRSTDGSRDSVRADITRAEHRRDAGVATDADVLALVARAADLDQRAIQLRGDGAIAKAELNRLTGAPIDRAFSVVMPPEGAREAGTDDLASLLAEAETSRPEMRRAAAAQQAVEVARASVRSALLPQVTAQAGWEADGTSFDARAAAWSAGGDLRWSLSLGGAEVARLRSMTDARARAAADAEDARAAVHLEVITAFHRLRTAAAQQTAGRAAVDQARESERIVRDRFESGLAGVTDLLRASGAVLEAEAQRVSAMTDLFVGIVQLRRAVGRPLLSTR